MRRAERTSSPLRCPPSSILPADVRVETPPALPTPSPVQLGYRMPAEWELHTGTWLTWPHCEETWPGKLDAVVPAYVAMIGALRQGETVHVNVLDEEAREAVDGRLEAQGIPTGPGSRVRLHVVPTDDEWIRDYGALFVVREPEGGEGAGIAATNWLFNAWGEKYDRIVLNNRVPEAMADYLNAPLFDCPIILEGGSIDVNGQGLCLTTEACLLNENRNPALSKTEIEQWLLAGLGLQEVLWLGEGIAGDDTDGHVDDLTRFVAPDAVVTVVEEDPEDENYAPLRDNLQRLQRLRTRAGGQLRIVELPMPRPLFWEGQRLPASYANFYIGNRVVLLPVFDDPADTIAQGRVQSLFPTREVVPIDARDLVWGLGAFHCLTQQVPAPPPARQAR